jgi:hypothetical protein
MKWAVLDSNTLPIPAGKPQNPHPRAAESDVVNAPKPLSEPFDLPPADPELARLVKAWPMLPLALKAGIVAMVKAAG